MNASVDSIHDTAPPFTAFENLVTYKNEAQRDNARVPREMPSPESYPLGLADPRIDAITPFLSYALRHPASSRYVPARLTMGSAVSDDEPQSQLALGCR